MLVHKFGRVNASQFALTMHKDGSNLPAGGVPWGYVGQLDIKEDDPPRIGGAAKAIIEAINEKGIYLWPEKT